MKSVQELLVKAKKRTEREPMPLELEKLRQLILYITAQYKDDLSFGLDDLGKVLFCADFLSYALYGEPITGVPYVKLSTGPAPIHLTEMKEQLMGDQHIARVAYMTAQETLPPALPEHIVPCIEPNLEHFSGRDIAVIHRVIQELSNHTRGSVAGLPLDLICKIAHEGEVIPYGASLLSDEPITDQQIEKAKRLAAERGWANV